MVFSNIQCLRDQFNNYQTKQLGKTNAKPTNLTDEHIRKMVDVFLSGQGG